MVVTTARPRRKCPNVTRDVEQRRNDGNGKYRHIKCCWQHDHITKELSPPKINRAYVASLTAKRSTAAPRRQSRLACYRPHPDRSSHSRTKVRCRCTIARSCWHHHPRRPHHERPPVTMKLTTTASNHGCDPTPYPGWVRAPLGAWTATLAVVWVLALQRRRTRHSAQRCDGEQSPCLWRRALLLEP